MGLKILLLTLGLAATPAAASPFTAGAGIAAPEGVGVLSDNPAADVHRRTSDIEGGIFFRRTEADARYQGYQTDQRSYGGVDPVQSAESLNAAFSRGRFSFTIAPVPPLSLPSQSVDDIPIVLLGQPNFVDATITPKIEGGLGLATAYMVTPRFFIAARAAYLAAGADVAVYDHSTGLSLFNASASAQVATSTIGGYLQATNSLSLGLMAIPYSSATVDIKSFQAPGVGVSLNSLPTPPLADRRAFPQVAFGIGLILLHRLALLGDVIYTRADPTPQLSPIELRTKSPDTYDTVGFRAGAVLGLSSSTQAQAGVSYTPATKGDGGIGPGSKTGYTSVDFLPVALGFAELTPLWEGAAGIRYSFDEAKKASLYFYRWSVASGVVYQQAARGVPATGEQPAVYYYQSLEVPVVVTFHF